MERKFTPEAKEPLVNGKNGIMPYNGFSQNDFLDAIVGKPILHQTCLNCHLLLVMYPVS